MLAPRILLVLLALVAVAAAAEAAADVRVTKTDDESPAIKAGEQFTYEIEVRNIGDVNAASVVLTDTLPPGLQYVSSSTTDGSCSFASGTLTCNLGTLTTSGSGEVSDIDLVVVAPTAGTYTNTASATTTTSEASTTNNQDSETTTIVARSTNVGVTKSDSPDPVFVGDILTYTLAVTNSGPDVARYVNLTDTLPAGVTFLTVTTTDGSCGHSGGVVTCALGQFGTSGSSSTATVTIKVRPTAPGALANNVAVTTSETDPTSANDADSESTNAVFRVSALSITKDDSADPVEASQQLVYRLLVTNAGPQLSRGNNVTDALPAGLTYVSHTTTRGTCGHASGSVTCALGSMAAGAKAWINVTVATHEAGVYTNYATVATSESDPDNLDNLADETTTVTPRPADMAISKEGPDDVTEGDPIAFVLEILNEGYGNATNVTVEDDVPAAFEDVTAESSQGSCSVTGNAVRCDLGDLDAGDGATVWINATTDVHDEGVYENFANVTAAEDDPDPSDDEDSLVVTVHPAPADLNVTKEESQDPAWVGFDLTYWVNVTNEGPGDAHGVVVTDLLPAGASFVGATPSQGGCDHFLATLTCDLGDLDMNATATIEIVVTPLLEGVPLTNVAGADANETDPDGGDDEATAVTDVTMAPADLAVTKEDSRDPVLVGEQFVYWINVTNAGPGNGSGSFVDELPPEVDLVDGEFSGDVGSASCDAVGDVVACEFDDIPPNGTFRVGLLVEAVAPGLAENAVNLTSETDDPDASDDNVTETTVILPEPVFADVNVTKTDQDDPVAAGDDVWYTMVVGNAGPDVAHNVTLVDVLPPGTTYSFADATQGDCELVVDTLTCDLGDLAPNATAAVTLAVTTSVPGTVNNTATVDADEIDEDLDDNVATEETTVVARSADLSVTKTDDPDPVVVGNELRYNITVTNHGPQNATNVTLHDVLPYTVWLDEGSTHGFGCENTGNESILRCTLALLEVGESESIELVVIPKEVGEIVNEANVTANETDPDTRDNAVAEPTTVVLPDGPFLECQAQTDGVHLEWTDVGEQYGVYRRNSTGDYFLLHGPTNDTSYVDTTVEVGQTYTYVIRALVQGQDVSSNECRVVAIPFFPTLLLGALAIVGGVAAYVALRRRHA